MTGWEKGEELVQGVVRDRHMTALSLASVRLGVGRCTILDAKLEISMSFVLASYSMLKTRGAVEKKGLYDALAQYNSRRR